MQVNYSPQDLLLFFQQFLNELMDTGNHDIVNHNWTPLKWHLLLLDFLGH